MNNTTHRIIRWTYLVLSFVPFFLLLFAQLSAGYLIGLIQRGHFWVMQKTPIERKFAK